ncbi:DUF3526 domain-containing protein [Bradyrhizobium sp. CCGE-LA001]|uniref:DUF3526 domain-containing protein n=1 Tax=Bradyrhizobium sp. CCGE-LA001 TaxID=1223566 RepID=UPI0002AAA9C7|nr:DUF3526 domain-containing protein [Bradyrhizobium sp. CCGE-LA001]AMA58964.1 hypothetical protein BCCGELA001_23630 [Bradyrhizobium sp. CCGE-LA001]
MSFSQSHFVPNFRLIARNEARILFRDGTLPLVILVLIVMIGWGFFVGLAQASLRDNMLGRVVAHEQETQQSNQQTLQSVLAGKEALVPFSNPANPAALAGSLSGRHTTLPNSPLAALSVGQSDLLPNYYRITYLSKVQFMYDTEIENPWNLLSGHFDLSFVIVFVLPLLAIALGYNLLSGEREQGTLRIVCSQPVSISTVVAGKLAVRLFALLAVAIPLPLFALALLRPETRGVEQMLLMLSWSALVVSYALFWFALAALVNVAGFSSSANALIMVAVWTVLVLILPVALNLVVNLVSPAPSRTELASRTRVVTADALREYEDLYSADYRYASDPEALAVKDGRVEIPSRMRAFFLAKQRVDERIEPLLKQFDRQLLEQQRLVDVLGFLSPAILVNEALNAIAGTDSRRFLAFKSQTETFHNSWREHFAPRILNDRATTSEDLNALPRWRWSEVSASDVNLRVWSRIVLILALVAALGAVALVRSTRGPVI